MTLTFDPIKHEYRKDGVVVPSVTQILSAEGFVDSRWFDEWSRGRGSMVHKAIEFYNEGDLDEDTLDPVLVPYVEAWKEFKELTRCKIVLAEQMVCSEIYGYAGTLDIFGAIDDQEIIIDLKSGAVSKATGLQLAAYALTLPNYHRIKRYGLRLQQNGRPSIKPFTDRNDYKVWQAAVAVHHWKTNNLKGR